MRLIFDTRLGMKFLFVVGFIGILAIVLIVPVVVRAQGFVVDWSNPEVLFTTPEGLKSNELWVLKDQADSLYLWWPLFDSDTGTEVINTSIATTLHTQMIDGYWRSPIDVMVWPDAGRLTSVVIDQEGLLHAFSATDCISYVNAQHDQAMSARAWGDRICLDETGLANPTVVRAENGTIYILYAALGNHSYRLIRSVDGGKTWSSYVTAVENPDNFLLDPMMAIDNEGRLHLVWSLGQAPDAYPPLGVYYSRSDNEGVNWTVPVQLGGIDEGQPAIAVNNDEVHVLWNGDASKRGRYYRYSRDAGETWMNVEVLSPPASQGGKGGLQRPPAIIIDDVGNVHVLLHEQESIFYMSKNDQGWTTKQSLYDPGMMRAAEVFTVRLAITGGNQLHAIYLLASFNQLNSQDSNNLLWTLFHQSREIDAVSQAPTPWPTPILEEPTSEPEIEIQTETEPSVKVTPQNILFTEESSGMDSYNPAWAIYVGVTTVSVFILILVMLFFIRQRR